MRIWYSVQGEGMGHAIRSGTIIGALARKHDLLITASDRAYEYLAPRYPGLVHRIEGGTFVYENNEVHLPKTAAVIARRIPIIAGHNIPQLSSLAREWRPDVLVSDFEPSAMTVAKLLRIPIIALDNIHELTQCSIDFPMGQLRLARAFIKGVFARADRYIITSFSGAKPLDPGTTVMVPPVVRDEVRALRPQTGDFVLVYQTSPSNKRMLEVLQKTKRHYRIYGMPGEESRANLEFRQFSPEGFLEDLRTCAYVIVNGGFTVISEALYLKKPILAVPIRNQTEQVYNAHCLKRRGYGDCTAEIAAEDLERFEAGLGAMRAALAKQKTTKGDEAVRALEKALKKLSPHARGE